MGTNNVTIKEIAKILKLHHTTVSRALRDHPDVSEKTKESVISLANRLGYHPNAIAQSFKNGKSKTIGVMIPDLKNDFFAHEISGIEDYAYNLGYDILICQSNEDYERERANISTLISNQVCGSLICITQNTQTGEHFKALKNRNIPLVFFDRVCQEVAAIKVITDDTGGAFSVTEHLILTGRKNIAHLGGPRNLLVGKQRFEGYSAALKNHGIPLDKALIIWGGFKREDGYHGMGRLLNNKKIDAVFAVNDLVAVGAILYLKENGIQIPADIAIAGFGDNEISTIIEPSLTTVKQTPFEIGKIAIKRLIDQIERQDRSIMPETVVVPTELVIRNSS